MSRMEIIPIRHTGAEGGVSAYDLEAAQAARAFHQTLPGYEATPLYELRRLAEAMGIRDFWVKDESPRFGLNAFKALGGSYAIHSLLADEPRTFVTATDGNHGRGVAWAARMLGRAFGMAVRFGMIPRRCRGQVDEGAVRRTPGQQAANWRRHFHKWWLPAGRTRGPRS